MGLFSGGNSKSTNTTNTNNSGFSDISDNASIAHVQGSGNTVTMLDGGAIAGAFSFAEKQSANAYEFSRDVTKEVGGQVSQAIQSVSESARSETENILISIQKYALYGALIWGAVQILRGFK